MLSKQPWLSPIQSYRPQDSSHSYDHPNLEVTQAKRSTRANAGFQIEIWISNRAAKLQNRKDCRMCKLLWRSYL